MYTSASRDYPSSPEKIALVNLGVHRFEGLSPMQLESLMESDYDRIVFAGDLYPLAQQNIRTLRLYGFDVEITGRLLEDDAGMRCWLAKRGRR